MTLHPNTRNTSLSFMFLTWMIFLLVMPVRDEGNAVMTLLSNTTISIAGDIVELHGRANWRMSVS